MNRQYYKEISQFARTEKEKQISAIIISHLHESEGMNMSGDRGGWLDYNFKRVVSDPICSRVLKRMEIEGFYERTNNSNEFDKQFLRYKQLKKFTPDGYIQITGTLEGAIKRYYKKIEDAPEVINTLLNTKKIIQNSLEGKQLVADCYINVQGMRKTMAKYLQMMTIDITDEEFDRELVLMYADHLAEHSATASKDEILPFEEYRRIKFNYLNLVLREIHNWELGKIMAHITCHDRFFTPLTNVNREIRRHIKINGTHLVEFDQHATFPTILSNILKLIINRPHDFCDLADKFIPRGLFYVEMAKEFEISDIAEAKLDVMRMFNSDTDWLWHKKFCERFPKDGEILTEIKSWKDFHVWKKKNGKWDRPKYYTNVNKLLTSEEVRIYTMIWLELDKLNIPFFSVHDAVLIQEGNEDKVFDIINKVMVKEFGNFYLIKRK